MVPESLVKGMYHAMRKEIGPFSSFSFSFFSLGTYISADALFSCIHFFSAEEMIPRVDGVGERNSVI